MHWTFFEISANFFQAGIMLYFIKNRLGLNTSYGWTDWACIVSIAGFFTLYLFWDIQIPDTLVFIFPMIYGFIVSKKKKLLVLYWTFVLAILFLSTINLAYHIFMSFPSMPYEVLMNSGFGRLCFVLITNIGLGVIVLLTSQFGYDAENLNWSVLLLFCLMLCSLFLLEEVVYHLQTRLAFENYGQDYPFFLAYICVFACTLLTILFFSLVSTSAAKELHYKAEIKFLEFSKQHFLEIEKIYKDLHIRQHDFKQHIQVLETLIQSNATPHAQEYLTEYHLCETSSTQPIFSGCFSLDALISAKYLTMKENNILFEYTPYLETELPISAVEFCTIVGNVLDNAIEGILRINNNKEEKRIKLSFVHTRSMLYIYCSNPCNELSIRRRNNTWLSSKENDGITLHSIGVNSINRIVDKNGGRCTFEVHNSTFYVRIVLPYPFKSAATTETLSKKFERLGSYDK